MDVFTHMQVTGHVFVILEWFVRCTFRAIWCVCVRLCYFSDVLFVFVLMGSCLRCVGRVGAWSER